MSPIVHGAFAPVANAAGERRCVEGRITSLSKKDPTFNSFVHQCMTEFVELVLDGQVLSPVCQDVVLEKQTGAAQKLSLAKAALHGPFVKRVLKCFIKAEAYNDVKDPRNISTYNDNDKFHMSRFMLALSAHLKQFPWYGPGKTPLELAERVASIASGATFLNISDYHRMDGTITYLLRSLDRMVCMKAFANHGSLMNDLLNRNCDNVGYLPHGTTFNQGPSHGSGCAGTSTLQTLRATFTSYLGYRRQGLTAPAAFASLGVHNGDDGADPDLSESAHSWAAGRVGLVLEAYSIPRGERGVTFLARYYSPEVWYGRTDSMCDIKRQLSKFHTTVRLPDNVPPEHKLVEKAMSYVSTDSNTPVIGEYCRRVLQLSSFRPKSLLGVGTWWSKFEQSAQYPNSNDGEWMDVELKIQFPEFDYDLFKRWLDKVEKSAELLEAPLCAEPRPPSPVKVSVVVDNDTFYPPGDCLKEPTPSDVCSDTSSSKSSRRNRSQRNPKSTVAVARHG